MLLSVPSIALIVFALISPNTETVNALFRPEAGKKGQKVSLQVISEGGSFNYEGTVVPCIYSASEIDTYIKEAKEYIDTELFYEGESAENVFTGLRLFEKVPNNPVKIKWDIEKNEFIDKKGVIQGDELKEDTLLVVRAVLSCQQYSCDYEFPVMLRKKAKSDTELFAESVTQEIDGILSGESEDNEIVLPSTLGGYNISYEKKKSNSLLLFGLLLGVLPFIFIAKIKEDDKNAIKKRTDNLKAEYADLVGKFVILLGAGMTVHNVFIRLAENYEKRKNAGGEVDELYEEVRITAGELKSGVYEKDAYVNFGRRIGMLSYVRFSTILAQNLKDGSRGILKRLDDEQMNALKDRKAYATQMGEKLETKILMPMVLELIIVLMIVIVPAFLSM